jgi:phage FluMu gp28-like protein
LASSEISRGYFLPYQLHWLADESRIKIWEKSRRIGATFVNAFEDVRDCVKGNVPSVWFSSADETAGKEYIGYCEKWATIFHMAAENLGETVIDLKRGIKATTLVFANGTKIHALSSNPKGFRSKGGKVILDEYAFHDDPDELWKAAKPCITWGYPLRILSTYNGKSNRYYRMVGDCKKGKLNWSLHTTTIVDAVAQGLADKIAGRSLSAAERQTWLDQERADCGDEDTWLQEYMCVPVDESQAFLTYDLIAKCERDDILQPLDEIQGDFFVGVDIGRKKDLTVIWGLERAASVKATRILKIMERATFEQQRSALYEILSHRKMRRACIDATGLGMQLAEEAQKDFGRYRVEAVTFTGKIKEAMAYDLRTGFEDVAILVPCEHQVREDLHSVRKTVTAAGNVRFDVASSEASGHADRFWAAALANHAASDPSGPIHIASRRRRDSIGLLRGFEDSPQDRFGGRRDPLSDF